MPAWHIIIWKAKSGCWLWIQNLDMTDSSYYQCVATKGVNTINTRILFMWLSKWRQCGPACWQLVSFTATNWEVNLQFETEHMHTSRGEINADISGDFSTVPNVCCLPCFPFTMKGTQMEGLWNWVQHIILSTKWAMWFVSQALCHKVTLQGGCHTLPWGLSYPRPSLYLPHRNLSQCDDSFVLLCLSKVETELNG